MGLSDADYLRLKRVVALEQLIVSPAPSDCERAATCTPEPSVDTATEINNESENTADDDFTENDVGWLMLIAVLWGISLLAAARATCSLNLGANWLSGPLG